MCDRLPAKHVAVSDLRAGGEGIVRLSARPRRLAARIASTGLGLLVALGVTHRAIGEEIDAALWAYLDHRLESRNSPGGVMVGLVDPAGTRFVSCGKLDNGTPASVTPDTIFEIGSITKTFTAVLLADMGDRGEMRLDDPITVYLPDNTRVPTFEGARITLRHLATHTAGLPRVPENLNPTYSDNPYADYAIDGLYDFLGRFKLARAPGAVSEYSTTGMGLLGHVIERKAGAGYEALVLEHICRPLAMQDTVVTLSPEQQSRFAVGHNSFGERVRAWDFGVLAGAGALRSTARDLSAYVSANLGFSAPRLVTLMQTTQRQRLAWFVSPNGVISHGGGTAGCASFVGVWPERRRGVVILTNTHAVFETDALGNFLLDANWGELPRLEGSAVEGRKIDEYVGQYRPTLTVADRVDNATGYILSDGGRAAGGLGVGVLATLGVVWFYTRRRSVVRRIAVAVVLGAATMVALAAAYFGGAFATVYAPSFGIFREGGRLFATRLGGYETSDVFALPPQGGELMALGDDWFVERLSRIRLHFDRDHRGEVTGLEARQMGERISFERMSPTPAGAEEAPAQPRVVVAVARGVLESYVGEYDFPADALSLGGFAVEILLEGEQLMGRAQGEKTIPGKFALFARSETTFFTKLDEGLELEFQTNEHGVVTRLIRRQAGTPTCMGMRRTR